ncbi:uncharacterized protein LOC117108176 [Anneissia japonica]|uniref:uncharacterized protein LOC117108176 n=1 Tax=Anneissia japonica TaxID=1529436 RepID=UPI00142559A0|nr:uncharacterized protein LOC117108176 [Anneissia japonica]
MEYIRLSFCTFICVHLSIILNITSTTVDCGVNYSTTRKLTTTAATSTTPPTVSSMRATTEATPTPPPPPPTVSSKLTNSEATQSPTVGDTTLLLDTDGNGGKGSGGAKAIIIALSVVISCSIIAILFVFVCYKLTQKVALPGEALAEDPEEQRTRRRGSLDLPLGPTFRGIPIQFVVERSNLGRRNYPF